MENDLEQNRGLPHPPQLLGHHQGRDRRQHDTSMTSSGGNRGTTFLDAAFAVLTPKPVGRTVVEQTARRLRRQGLHPQSMSDESTEQHWAHLWSTGDTNWHNPDGDPFLKKHQDVILAGKEDAQVFVPLCGKAVELKW
ncbi:hypothetical protein ISCGN_023910 [Ixodes scapularis]